MYYVEEKILEKRYTISMQELDKPIDGNELLELHRFFPKHTDTSFSLVSLDGFFHGLALLVKNVMPSEWLQDVLPVAQPQDLNTLLELCMRYYNTVMTNVLQDESEPYFDGSSHQAKIWLEGLGRAFSYDEETLLTLSDAEAEAAGEENVPLSALFVAFTVDVDSRHEKGSKERKEILELRQNLLNLFDGYSAAENQSMVADLITTARELLEPARESYLNPKPTTRAAPKVGRNDPCPCGSGRKYKHCHGKT
jgi:SEC-C motif/Uncharacterised protein family (UPF0149)